MNLLFGQNISFRILTKIKTAFLNADHVKNLGLENASDIEIWNLAKIRAFASVNLDMNLIDFSNIIGPLPKVICLRVGNQTTVWLAEHLLSKIDIIKEFLGGAYQDAVLILSGDMEPF